MYRGILTNDQIEKIKQEKILIPLLIEKVEEKGIAKLIIDYKNDMEKIKNSKATFSTHNK